MAENNNDGEAPQDNPDDNQPLMQNPADAPVLTYEEALRETIIFKDES